MMMPPWCLPQVGYKIGSADTVQLGDVIPNLKEFTEGAFLPASAARVVLRSSAAGLAAASHALQTCRAVSETTQVHARFAEVCS